MRPFHFEKRYGVEEEEEAVREAQKIIAMIEQRSRDEHREQEIEVANGVHWMVPVRVSESDSESMNSISNLRLGWT